MCMHVNVAINVTDTECILFATNCKCECSFGNVMNYALLDDAVSTDAVS